MARAWLSAAVIAAALAVAPAVAQVTPPATPPASAPAPAPLPPRDTLEGRPIARVEIEGNTRTEAKTILDQIRSQAGQPYSRAQLDVDTRTIAAMGRFSSVRAAVVPTADARVVIRFIVEERQVVTALQITGNHRKSDQQIRDLIITHAGMPADPFILQQDIEAIKKLYREDGYNFATVTLDKDALEKQGIVHYQIEEGPKARISNIVFEGNAHLKSSFLKWKIATKTYIWIFRKGTLDQDKLDADVATVRDIYIGKGFLDVQASYSLEYSADKKKLTVRFAVIEGPRYRIGKINIAGNKVYSTDSIRSDIVVNPGDFVDKPKLESSQRHIEDRYGHEGYIYRTVEMKPSYTDTPGVVDLNYTITEGKAYSVGRIIVRGNANTQDRVIRRQIRIYPDQTYDTVLVRKSVERLKATRLFQDAKVTPIGNDPDTRDALVEVQEAQTGRFLIGAGISTDSGVLGQVSLEQQNFDITNYPHSMGEFLRGQSWKGAGQYFRLLLEPGTELQRYRVTFEEPYLFDTPYSFGNDLYFFTRSRESWNERRIGDIVTLGRRFGDIWSTSVSFRAEQVTISSVHDNGVPGVSDISYSVDSDGNVTTNEDSAQQVIDGQGSHFLTSIKPAVVRDTTDSRIFPTTGTRAALSWEQYGLGGDVTMSKLVARFDWYYPLYTDLFDRKTVLIQRNELGVVPFGDSVFYERFYGGGIGSLRAFKFRGISPRQGPRQDPIGGDFSWVSSVEVNYPIWEDILRGVVFAEVGTVESDITIDSIRSDVGVGIRLSLPFLGQIPLALDFGLPVTKASGDKTQVVSFSLGVAY